MNSEENTGPDAAWAWLIAEQYAEAHGLDPHLIV